MNCNDYVSAVSNLSVLMSKLDVTRPSNFRKVLKTSVNREGCFLNQDILILTFHVNSRTTVPFVTAHLELFHCTHHSVIPKSDLYFTFCFTLNALSKRTSK